LSRICQHHPFLDGNGRVCRLILNAVLLNYAGIVVALGEKEDDRKEYLEITNMVSMDEQIPEDERSEKRLANLASYVIKKSMEKMGTLRDTLNKAA
jgi:Fic family protein